MSGEVVVIAAIASPVGLTVVSAMAAVAAASLAMDTITAMQEQKRAEARSQIQQHKQQLDEWTRFQKEQHQRIKALADTREQLRKNLATIRVAESGQPIKQTSKQVKAKGFVEKQNERFPEKQQIAKLLGFLDQLSEELQQDAQSLFQRLKRQGQELLEQLNSPNPPLSEMTESFQNLVSSTLQGQFEGLEAARATRQRLLGEIENLLDGVLYYRGLSGNHEHTLELIRLQDNLTAMLDKGEISVADLELTDSKFEQLKSAVDRANEMTAVTETLRHSMTGHLEAMGYDYLGEESGDALWGIPGGEQVRVALHPDLRVGFQMRHEREHESRMVLSSAELAFLRHQEAKWCGDLIQLIEHLLADGFQYQVGFERPIPEESVPIVVVEDVDELLEERRPPADRKQRHLT